MNTRAVRTSILMTLLLAVTLTPESARAQGNDTSTVVAEAQPILTNPQSVDTSQPLGPRIAPVGATRSMALAPVMIPMQSRSVGKSKAMMVVGVAAIVVGAVIGGEVGTVFMVGGGVVGLIGLYRYMQ